MVIVLDDGVPSLHAMAYLTHDEDLAVDEKSGVIKKTVLDDDNENDRPSMKTTFPTVAESVAAAAEVLNKRAPLSLHDNSRRTLTYNSKIFQVTSVQKHPPITLIKQCAPPAIRPKPTKKVESTIDKAKLNTLLKAGPPKVAPKPKRASSLSSNHQISAEKSQESPQTEETGWNLYFKTENDEQNGSTLNSYTKSRAKRQTSRPPSKLFLRRSLNSCGDEDENESLARSELIFEIRSEDKVIDNESKLVLSNYTTVSSTKSDGRDMNYDGISLARKPSVSHNRNWRDELKKKHSISDETEFNFGTDGSESSRSRNTQLVDNDEDLVKFEQEDDPFDMGKLKEDLEQSTELERQIKSMHPN